MRSRIAPGVRHPSTPAAVPNQQLAHSCMPRLRLPAAWGAPNARAPHSPVPELTATYCAHVAARAPTLPSASSAQSSSACRTPHLLPRPPQPRRRAKRAPGHRACVRALRCAGNSSNFVRAARRIGCGARRPLKEIRPTLRRAPQRPPHCGRHPCCHGHRAARDVRVGCATGGRKTPRGRVGPSLAQPTHYFGSSW